jgi:5-methylcytosine-specific restriction endonuclease McrA
LAASSLPYPIVTRKEANSEGLAHYFTGKPCIRGHLAIRFAINGTCRECNLVRILKRLESSPERREYARKKALEWYADNRGRALARQARVRAKQDRNAVSEYNRKYREDNQAAIAEREARWKRENKDRVGVYIHRRRGRETNAEGIYTAEDVQLILIAQMGLCVGIRCTKDIRKCYTIDHILPLARGGSNWPANLQLLCRRCNARKGTRTMEEWRAAELSA